MCFRQPAEHKHKASCSHESSCETRPPKSKRNNTHMDLFASQSQHRARWATLSLWEVKHPQATGQALLRSVKCSGIIRHGWISFLRIHKNSWPEFLFLTCSLSSALYASHRYAEICRACKITQVHSTSMCQRAIKAVYAQRAIVVSTSSSSSTQHGALPFGGVDLTTLLQGVIITFIVNPESSACKNDQKWKYFYDLLSCLGFFFLCISLSLSVVLTVGFHNTQRGAT